MCKGSGFLWAPGQRQGITLLLSVSAGCAAPGAARRTAHTALGRCWSQSGRLTSILQPCEMTHPLWSCSPGQQWERGVRNGAKTKARFRPEKMCCCCRGWVMTQPPETQGRAAQNPECRRELFKTERLCFGFLCERPNYEDLRSCQCSYLG